MMAIITTEKLHGIKLAHLTCKNKQIYTLACTCSKKLTPGHSVTFNVNVTKLC